MTEAANKKGAQNSDWPRVLADIDDLTSVTNQETGEVEYLFLDSPSMKGFYIRDGGRWLKADDPESFILHIDKAEYVQSPEDVEFIAEFDKMERDRLKKETAERMSLVAAASPPPQNSGSCPPATLDISLNLKNRAKAIDAAGYGPMNPNEENSDFWQAKADTWSVSPEDAKKSLCGNCVFFITTTKMKKCIADGIEAGGSGETSAWDAIDQAELGYCEAFDFKCAAKRTCDAWVVGGPITDDVESSRGI